MPGCITSGQKAAKIACLRHEVELNHQDYASMANAVHCGGSMVDYTLTVRRYFARCHSEIDLSDEQLADIGISVYNGLYGLI